MTEIRLRTVTLTGQLRLRAKAKSDPTLYLEAANEIDRLHFAEAEAMTLCMQHEAVIERLRGERDALVNLLVAADGVLSTLDGESSDEADRLAILRAAIVRAIYAA